VYKYIHVYTYYTHRERETHTHTHTPPVAVAKDDVGIEAITDHTDTVPLHAILIGEVINHEWGGLAHHHRLLPRAPFDGPWYKISQISKVTAPVHSPYKVTTYIQDFFF
jgi:hypothetical protein